MSVQEPTSHRGGRNSKSGRDSAENVVILIKRHVRVSKKADKARHYHSVYKTRKLRYAE